MKKIFLLILPLLVGLCACHDGKAEKESVTVETARGTEKIPADAAFKGGSTFVIDAVRNEVAAAQIIIHSDEDAGYELTLSDLTNAAGQKLAATSFNVFHEKMISLEKKFDYLSPMVIGDIPDALLPYEKAVEYRENRVKAGTNQPIWINLKTSEDQPAGKYTGAFSVKVGDKRFEVPAEITIRDYTLSDVTYSESAFRLRADEILLYEQDCSEEMQVNYYEFMLDHRLSCDFPFDISHSNYNYDLSYFLKYALRYSQDDRCSTYVLPYLSVEQYVEIDGNGYLAIDSTRAMDPTQRRMEPIQGYDWNLFSFVLRSMVETGFANGVDLFKKAVLSGTIFDEFTNDTSSGYMALNKAVYNLRRLDDAMIHLSEAISEATYSDGVVTLPYFIGFDEDNDNGGVGYRLVEDTIVIEAPDLSADAFDELKAAMVASAYDTVCHVTCTYVPPNFFFEHVTRCAVCYLANLYDTQENRSRIVDMCAQKGWKAWVYTCVMPYHPYATYHIEDMLLSARLLAWQMYDYGIIGNLLWGTAVATVVDDDLYTEQLVDQDYYQTGNRYPWANGDGFLLYPGRPYGISGPVSSIRLEAILDGNEDYDLFHALESFYGEGDNYKHASKIWMSGLYDGMAMHYGEHYLENFDASRALLNFLLEAGENHKTVIRNFENRQITLRTLSDTVIRVNGNILQNVGTDGGYAVYQFMLQDGMTLSSERGGVAYQATLQVK